MSKINDSQRFRIVQNKDSYVIFETENCTNDQRTDVNHNKDFDSNLENKTIIISLCMIIESLYINCLVCQRKVVHQGASFLSLQ